MRLEYGGTTYKLAVTGDVTGDGKVGITDLVQVRLASVGLRESFTGEYAMAADMNGSGTLTITDVIKSNLAVVSILDIIAPNSFVPEVRTTTETITVTGETVDSNSGVKEYWFEIDGSGWVKNTDSLNNTYTFEGLTKGTEYTIRMKVVDNEGNTKITKKVKVRTRSTENADIDVILTTENWTNQNVMASVYYNANIANTTKQISLNNGLSWDDYTGPITVDKNMTIRARVINEEGTVLAEQEKVITNIDKLAPNDFDIMTTVTESSVAITVETTDAIDENSEYGCSGIQSYVFQIYNDDWAKLVEIEKTSEETDIVTYTFENLADNTEYRIIVTAKDKAGNTKQQRNLSAGIIITEEALSQQYTLTINPNGGTYTGETTLTRRAGGTVDLVAPTRTGYDFEGWVITRGTGTLEDNVFTFGKGNATIKAIWEKAEDPEPEEPDIIYGEKVNYSANGINDWRVFYQDDDNIYLIAGDYVPFNKLPETSDESDSPNTRLVQGDKSCSATFTNILVNCYSGSEWILRNGKKSAEIASKWLHWVNVPENSSSTNDNIMAVAYMLDTEAWSDFKNATYADYAIGGPTLEMYCASYKETHPSKYIEYQNVDNGYDVKWRNGSYGNFYVDGIATDGEFGKIYVDNNQTNAYGYMLASPSGYDRDLYIYCAENTGKLKYCLINYAAYGFRPIVCLKSNVKLVPAEDGDGFDLALETNTHTITFDAQGGTVENATITQNYGTVITLPIATKEGFKLEGWYKNSDCTSGNKVGAAGDEYTITETRILYANWEIDTIYGEKVNYSANGINDWRVFYQDDDNIYLIAGDYIPYNKLPVTTLGTKPTYDGEKKFYFGNVSEAYSGSAWILRPGSKPAEIANKWLHWLEIESNQNINSEGTGNLAYMLDTEAWSDFKNATYADYAIGGPTLEMYCKSYKETHKDVFLEWRLITCGYEVKRNIDGVTFYGHNVPSLPYDGEYDQIYTNKGLENNMGYWLASTSVDVNRWCVMITPANNGLGSVRLSNGFRPIVCLKSNVKLVPAEDGDGFDLALEGPQISVTGNPTEWTKEDVELTITATNTESPVTSIKVNGTPQTLSGGQCTYTVTENENYTIVATSANGISTTETVNVSKIDKTAPTITFDKQSNTTELTTQEVAVTVTETGSGKSVYKYLWSESPTSPENEDAYTDGEFSSGDTISKTGLAGEYYLHVYMKDVAGNVNITKTTGKFKFRYEIWTEEDLIKFLKEDCTISNQYFKDKTVHLMSNINVTSKDIDSRSRFDGTFEGNNKIITLNNDIEFYTWIQYHYIFNENMGTIQNVRVDAGNNALSLVNLNYGTIKNCEYSSSVTCPMVESNAENPNDNTLIGIIENCSRTGSVTQYNSDRYGGITYQNSGIIRNCANTANINVVGDALNSVKYGGIVCENNYKGIIESCYNTGNINVKSNNSICVSGIVVESAAVSGRVWKCYNTGNIIGTTSEADNVSYVGGIVANLNPATYNNTYLKGKIQECYNTGAVTLNSTVATDSGYVGGIFGSNAGGGSIENCYNTGTVTSCTYAGGICGWASYSTIINNCYNTGTVSGNNSSGSICGYSIMSVSNCYYINDPAYGVGPSGATGCTQKTLLEMKDITMVYSLGDLWTRNATINNGLPILKWQVAS